MPNMFGGSQLDPDYAPHLYEKKKERRLEVICQRWHDTDQTAGCSLHLGFKNWRDYLTEMKETNKDRYYPVVMIREPILVEVYSKTYQKLEKDNNIHYGYDRTNVENLVEEKIVKKIIG